MLAVAVGSSFFALTYLTAKSSLCLAAGQGDASKWRHIFAGVSDEDSAFLAAVASRMLLHNASGLERRVLKPLQSFPFRLLWLVRSAMGERCSARQQIASELLSADADSLEITARKIKARFGESLQLAARTGLMRPRLFWLLKTASMIWKPDVRENERLNKQVKLLDQRCTSIGLDLKSARLTLKYVLGSAGEAANRKSKFSDIRPAAVRVRDLCLSGWPDMVDIMSNPRRWLPTSRPDSVPCPQEVTAEYRKLRPGDDVNYGVQYAWSASYSMVVHRSLAASSHLREHPLCPVALCFKEGCQEDQQAARSFWISAAQFRKRHILCKAEWRKDLKQLTWSQLQGFEPLVNLIKKFYKPVQSGAKIVNIYQLGLQSIGDAGSGELGVASVKSIRHLLELQQPTANFLKKLDHQCPGKQANQQAPAGKNENSHARAANEDARAAHDDLQEAGLNMLAEEVEACGLLDTSDTTNTAEDGDADNRDDDEEHVFRQCLRHGITAAFESDNIAAAIDDAWLERRAEQLMTSLAGEGVVDAYEQSVAASMVASKKCDIDTAGNQSVIQHLFDAGLDPVDAATETAIAAAVGSQAVGEETAASASSSTARRVFGSSAQLCILVR